MFHFLLHRSKKSRKGCCEEEIEMVDMKELAHSLDEAYGFSKTSENDARSRTANASAASFRYATPTANDQRTSFSTKRTAPTANGKRLEDRIERYEAHEEEEISFVHTPTGTVQGDTPTPTSLIHPSGSGKLQHFQKRREKSARILITIVLAFLFCHTFRFVIEAYEVTHPSHSTYEHHTFCLNNKK